MGSVSGYEGRGMFAPEIIEIRDVLNMAIPVEAPVFGIYFLLENEQVVYVGKSKDCRARIQQHMNDKSFDAYTISECDLGIDLDELEAVHIAHYLPRDNRQIPEALGFISIYQVQQRGISKHQLNRWAAWGLAAPVFMGGGIFYREADIRAAFEQDVS